MKLIFGLTLCMLSFAASASNEIAQALYSNSDMLTKIKSECGSDLSEVKTTEISPGIFKHKITVSKMQPMMGLSPKCVLTIEQDYTPIMSDGVVEYKIDLQKL